MSAWGGRGRGGTSAGTPWGNGRGRGQVPPNNGNGNENGNTNFPGMPQPAPSSIQVGPAIVAVGRNTGTANPWNRFGHEDRVNANTIATLHTGNGNGNGSGNSSPDPTANGSIIVGSIQRLQIRNIPPPYVKPPACPETQGTQACSSRNEASASGESHPRARRQMKPEEEGRRGRRERPTFAERNDYVDTRANITNSSKMGTLGTRVDLVANYFKLKRKPDWCIFHYHVDYRPEQKNTRLKRELVALQNPILGSNVTDGDSIWTSHRLEMPMSLTSTSRRGEHVELDIKLVGEVDNGDPRRLQIYNVILRTCMGPTPGLGLVLNRRNYFDPERARRDITNSRLTIWPGYVTTLRQFDEDLLLNVGIKHKIIRSETCLDKIRGLGTSKAKVMEELVGSIVLTQYNNKTYKIADVDFTKTPSSTFDRNGTLTTYMEYYQTSHGVTIRDGKQPLLMAELKKKDFHRGPNAAGGVEKIYLIPELCHLTGLTDFERGDFGFMKALNAAIMQNPSQKMASTLAFMERLRTHPGVSRILNGWGLVFETRPVDIQARALPSQAVFMAPNGGRDNGKLQYDGSDWTREIVRSRKMEECKKLARWIIIRPSQHPNQPDQARKILVSMREVGVGLGFGIPDPLQTITVGQGRQCGPGDFQKALQAVFAQHRNLDLVLVILPNDKKESWAIVKRECCLAGVYSQCVVARTINKDDSKFRSVATKVVIQINAKLGGVPWKLEAPFKAPTMLVGFDVYHCGKGTGRSVGAMVSTYNPSLSKVYSTPTWQDRGQELSTMMCTNITKCVQAFAKQNNGLLPGTIVFFRDGVGEGQLHYVVQVELTAIKDALKHFYETAGKSPPKLTVVVVTKRINARFFKPDRASGHVDALPGTVVDSVVTHPERYDFFLTSVKAPREGSASPTSYNVIWDDNCFKPDMIQTYAYRQCHAYYNWSGTVSVPAVCQYAHKLAFLVGMANLTPEMTEPLSYSPYYL